MPPYHHFSKNISQNHMKEKENILYGLCVVENTHMTIFQSHVKEAHERIMPYDCLIYHKTLGWKWSLSLQTNVSNVVTKNLDNNGC